MTINKNIILNRGSKKPILIDTFYNENSINQKVIIFCHGYKGFKDWGAWNILAERIAQSGFCFVKFNFSHNGGTVENPIDFPDLEAFGFNNYTKELDDLNDVIDWVHNHFKGDSSIRSSHITLLGHSRGGGIVTIKAEEDERVSNVISLAGVSDFGLRFPKDKAFEQWQKDGVYFVVNGRTKQNMPHYYQFYEDFIQNEQRLTIKRAATNLKIPHLIIHGDQDSSVLADEAYTLHQWNPKSELQIIKGANHVFNVKHPWHDSELSNELNEVSQFIIDYISK